MEEQLRIAVDQLGDPSGHGTPGERIFLAMEEACSLVASTPESVLSECLCSPELVLLLASDHSPVCSTAVRLVTAVVGRLGGRIQAALDDPEGFLELLDELVYKLSTVSDAQCARSIVSLLMTMLEYDEGVLELVCQKYRGIRPVLRRWQGDGFDLLLKKFGDAVISGDLQLAEEEHRRRAATLIQAHYRGHRLRRRLADATGTIARLQRKIRLRQSRAVRQSLQQQRQQSAAFCSALQRQRQRRQHTERMMQSVSDVSADQVPVYLRERRRSAAARIQTAWRACRVRRQMSDWRRDRRRHRAALTVQRWWRHCLIRLRADAADQGPPLQLTQHDIEKYQRQIDSAVEAARLSGGDTAVPSRPELQRRLAECQSALGWSARRLTREAAGRRRCHALLAHTQAICGLLEQPAGRRPLEEYWCAGRQQAARARLLHRRATARAAAPWWRRLEDEEDGY